MFVYKFSIAVDVKWYYFKICRNENESVVLYPSIHAGIVPGHLEGGVREAVQDLHGILINDTYSSNVNDKLYTCSSEAS